MYFSEFCKCGLKKEFHTEDALKADVTGTEWNVTRDTDTVYPWIFGNLIETRYSEDDFDFNSRANVSVDQRELIHFSI